MRYFIQESYHKGQVMSARDLKATINDVIPPDHYFTVTESGKRVDYFYPSPDCICIEDIASSLSITFRFRSSHMYSVAQHSLYVAALAGRKDSALARDGLMHDATEAYMSDIPSPLKRGLARLNLNTCYSSIENYFWEHAIAPAFELSATLDAEISRCDQLLCVIEKRALFLGFERWPIEDLFTEEEVQEAMQFFESQGLPLIQDGRIDILHPAEAREQFMETARSLKVI
jgi:hypothetical protein